MRTAAECLDMSTSPYEQYTYIIFWCKQLNDKIFVPFDTAIQVSWTYVGIPSAPVHILVYILYYVSCYIQVAWPLSTPQIYFR